jgi:hypothetical protein
MKRFSVFLGILGMAAALVLPADAQKQATLFGKTYNIVSESRGQTYKGKAIVLPDTGNRKANLFFAQGANEAADRLFVSCGMASGVEAHHLYSLTGADANGMFTKDLATVTEYFGGVVDNSKGGRPGSVMLISDANTGVKTDRNVLITTQDGSDSYRYYDLDTMKTGYAEDAVLTLVVRGSTPGENDVQDENSPFHVFNGFAPGPAGTIVNFGRASASGGVEVGVHDPKLNAYFPVLTQLHTATSNAVPEDAWPTSAIRNAENEYWLLTSASDPSGDNDSTDSNMLYRLRLTFPADLTKGPAGSIKVEVMDKVELKGTNLAGASDGGMFGIAAGREIAPGLRRLYFADWQGNLYTATPVP